jgi:hypothetical protein
MPSTVFPTIEVARGSYEDWGFNPGTTSEQGIDRDKDKETAVKFAHFLCDKRKFETSLDYISGRLWEQYIKIPPTTNNRLTRAISLVAEPLGFGMRANQVAPLATHGDGLGVPVHIKLVGGDPELGYMLRNKLFWKDSMDNWHGEYTHCFQWLAIAREFPGEASDLYAKLSRYRARNAPDSKPVYLWQWLADCFPTKLDDIATECTKSGSTEKICSDSYRSPQILTDYLVRNPRAPLKRHFISHYLCKRYQKRGWLNADDKKGVLRTLGGNAKARAEERQAAGGWTESARGPHRWLRTGVPENRADVHGEEVEFHYRKGIL